MMRLSTIFFCILLAAAAAGRYRAEVNVRSDKVEIAKFQEMRAGEKEQIDRLRLDVRVLESAPRTAKLSRLYTDLEQLKPNQMQNSNEFLKVITPPNIAETIPSLDEQYIVKAIAMVDFNEGQ